METDDRIRELASQIEIQQLRLNVASIAMQTLVSVMPNDIAAYFAKQLKGRVTKLMQDHSHFVSAEADAALTAELNVLLAAAARSGPA